jgi:hypothetical protein
MIKPRPPSARRHLVWLLSALAIVPAACAAWMMAAAWDHNPQEEFHGAAGIQWGPWLAIGLSWFLALWLPLAVLGLILWFLGTRWQSRTGPPAV